MELIYGDNAEGKTKYAKKKKEEEEEEENMALVLNSRMSNWKDDNSFSQFHSQKIKLKKEKEELINSLFETKNRSFLGYLGSSTLVKKLIKDNPKFINSFSSIKAIDKIISNKKIIQIGTISKELININLMNELGNVVEAMNLLDYNDLLGITKFYSSIKKKTEKGSQNFISDLIEIRKNTEKRLKELSIKNNLSNIAKKWWLKYHFNA